MQIGKLFEARYWEGFSDVSVRQFILTGLQVTLLMAIVSIVASLLLGTVLALARSSRYRALSLPATGYIELIRALPVLFLIFFAYFGGARFGLRDPVVAATVALIAYTSAVNAEIVRAGIGSIEHGQVVTLIKDTSLAYVVGTTELMRRVFILRPAVHVRRGSARQQIRSGSGRQCLR
jgi:His/Glu/Gln/Arg/opine family amino acid ABC transporter permease subunit